MLRLERYLASCSWKRDWFRKLERSVRAVAVSYFFSSEPVNIQTFESLVPPHPDAPSTPKYTAYLHLAQLSDEDPHLALRHYQSALDILTALNKGKERAAAPGEDSDPDADIRGTIVRVLISMVEIWMDPSYDLWYGNALWRKNYDDFGFVSRFSAASTPRQKILANG